MYSFNNKLNQDIVWFYQHQKDNRSNRYVMCKKINSGLDPKLLISVTLRNSSNINYLICKWGLIISAQSTTRGKCKIKVNGEYKIALQIWKYHASIRHCYLWPFGKWYSWENQSLISLICGSGESRLHGESDNLSYARWPLVKCAFGLFM